MTLICANCNKKIERNSYDVRSKNSFCNRSCAQSYNNSHSPKRKLILTLTLQHYQKGNYRTYKTRINESARRIFIASKLPLVCNKCGYSKHVEIAHIKAVREFPTTATIGEVNNIKNLVALCPTCHWEFDNL